ARRARAATASGSSPSAATGRKAAFTWGSSGCVFELDAVAGKDLAGELLEHGHRLEVVRGRARLAEAALRQLVLAPDPVEVRRPPRNSGARPSSEPAFSASRFTTASWVPTASTSSRFCVDFTTSTARATATETCARTSSSLTRTLWRLASADA